MKLFHAPLMHARLDDGSDLGGDPKDRGDDITDDEKKVAEELAAKEKAAADAKAKEEAAAKEEEEGDDEGDEDGEDKDKRKRIPLSRHKAILEAERTSRSQLEAKLAQYENGADVAAVNEEITKAEEKLLKQEAEYAQLVTDDKHGEAAKVMAEIRKTERFISEAKGDLKAAAAESRADERARYDEVVDRIEAAYPQLNPDSDEKDPVMIRKVLAVSRGYQTDGMTPAKALQEAVKDLIGDPKTAKQRTATETTPRVDEAAAKKAAREEEARKKAAEAAAAQPASAKLGRTSDSAGKTGTLKAADVMKMSQTEFAKLDEASLAAMRGDDGLPDE